MPRTKALLLGLLLAAGCSRTSLDTAPPDEEDDTPAPAATMQPIGDRPLTASGVYLDPGLAALCEIETAQAYFEFDSAALSRDAEDVMVLLADCVKDGPLAGRQIEVVGHTDPRGTDAYNAELGQSRAESVRSALLRHGVSDDEVKAESAGEKQSHDQPSAWPYDRRVDVRIAPMNG